MYNNLYNSMKREEFEKLVKRKVLAKQSYIELYDNKNDTYKVDKIFTNGYLIIKNIDTGNEKRISYKDIKNLDGMSIEKICKVYTCNLDDKSDIIKIYNKTNIEKEIINKKSYSIDTNDEIIPLCNDMKIVFFNDVKKDYCNKILIVKFENGRIKFKKQRGRPKKINN